MTSEDWKTVLLALIATISGLGMSAIAGAVTIYGQLLLKRAKDAKDASELAVGVAVSTRTEMTETRKAMNGRIDDLMASMHKEKELAVADAYARGHAAGVAKVSQAVADSPAIPMTAQAVAQAVANTSEPGRPA